VWLTLLLLGPAPSGGEGFVDFAGLLSEMTLRPMKKCSENENARRLGGRFSGSLIQV
jgi:hypothetical protein